MGLVFETAYIVSGSFLSKNWRLKLIYMENFACGAKKMVHKWVGPKIAYMGHKNAPITLS